MLKEKHALTRHVMKLTMISANLTGAALNGILASILKWWQSHPLISLVVTGGAIASSIAHYVNLGKLISEWWTRDGASYLPTENELEHVVNGRFGFCFDYPRHWNRTTSTNNDGHIIRHPENPKIEIRGWGSYDVAKQGLDNWAVETAGVDLREVSVTEVSVVTRTRTPVSIEGRRITTKTGRTWSVQLLIEHRGVQASVLCSCPKRLFPQYEKFFVDTCHTLSFTEEPGKTDEAEHEELLRSMPKLMDDMRNDLSTAGAEFIREFFVLPNRRVMMGAMSKPRFIYYEEDYQGLMNQLDLLEEQTLLKDITPLGNNAPIYRMTEKLVTWLRANKSNSQSAPS